MMTVIILQERNAEPPASVKNGVGIVSKSADTLYDTALAIAREDYKEYSDIKAEIELAAGRVNESSIELKTAVNGLFTDEAMRQKYWKVLVSSCKNMSAKTIQLLQIVYGAEREKVYRAAQNFFTSINKLNSANQSINQVNQENINFFAAKVLDSAASANKLIEHLKLRTEDATPIKRNQLVSIIKQLNQVTSTVVEDTNALLKNPDDDHLKTQLNHHLGEVKSTITHAVNILKEIEAESPKAVDAFNFTTREIFIDDQKQPINVLVNKQNQLTLASPVSNEHNQNRELSLDENKQQGNNNANSEKQESQSQSKGRNRKKPSDLKKLQQPKDEVIRKIFNDLENEFSGEENRKVNAGNVRLLEDVDIILAIKQEKQELDNITDDIINKRAPQLTTESLANIQQINDKLANLIDKKLKNPENEGKIDPQIRNALEICKKELIQLYPTYEAIIKQALKNAQNDPTNDHRVNLNREEDLKRANSYIDGFISKIVEFLQDEDAEIIATAKKQIEDIEKIQASAIERNPHQLSRSVRSAIKENKHFVNLCKKKADNEDDEQKKILIIQSINDIQKLLPSDIHAAKEIIQNPEPSAEDIKKINDITNKMEEEIKSAALLIQSHPELQLLDAIENENNCIKKFMNLLDSPEDIDRSPIDDEVLIPYFLDNSKVICKLGKQIAKKYSDDPDKQLKIEQTVNKIEPLIQPIIDDVKLIKANSYLPKDQLIKHYQSLDDKFCKLNELLNDLKDECSLDLFDECIKQIGNLYANPGSFSLPDTSKPPPSLAAVPSFSSFLTSPAYFYQGRISQLPAGASARLSPAKLRNNNLASNVVHKAALHSDPSHDARSIPLSTSTPTTSLPASSTSGDNCDSKDHFALRRDGSRVADSISPASLSNSNSSPLTPATNNSTGGSDLSDKVAVRRDGSISAITQTTPATGEGNLPDKFALRRDGSRVASELPTGSTLVNNPPAPVPSNLSVEQNNLSNAEALKQLSSGSASKLAGSDVQKLNNASDASRELSSVSREGSEFTKKPTDSEAQATSESELPDKFALRRDGSRINSDLAAKPIQEPESKDELKDQKAKARDASLDDSKVAEKKEADEALREMEELANAKPTEVLTKSVEDDEFGLLKQIKKVEIDSDEEQEDGKVLSKGMKGDEFATSIEHKTLSADETANLQAKSVENKSLSEDEKATLHTKSVENKSLSEDEFAKSIEKKKIEEDQQAKLTTKAALTENKKEASVAGDEKAKLVKKSAEMKSLSGDEFAKTIENKKVGGNETAKLEERHPNNALAKSVNELVELAKPEKIRGSEGRIKDILNKLPIQMLQTNEETLRAKLNEQFKIINELLHDYNDDKFDQVKGKKEKLKENQREMRARVRNILEKKAEGIDADESQIIKNLLNSLDKQIRQLDEKLPGNQTDSEDGADRIKFKQLNFDRIEKLKKDEKTLGKLVLPKNEKIVKQKVESGKELLKGHLQALKEGNKEKIEGNLKEIEKERKTFSEKFDKFISDDLKENEKNKKIQKEKLNNINAKIDELSNKSLKSPAEAQEITKKSYELLHGVLDSKITPLALAIKEETYLNQLNDAIQSSDPNSVALIRKLVDFHKQQLKPAALQYANSLINEKKKSMIEKIIGNIDTLLPDHIKLLKSIVAQSSNKPLDDAQTKQFNLSTAAVRNQISKLISALNPSINNQIQSKEMLNEFLFAKLKTPGQVKSKEELDDVLNQIQQNNEKLLQQVYQIPTNNSISFEKQKAIREAGKKLDGLLKKLPEVSEKYQNANPSEGVASKEANDLAFLTQDIQFAVENVVSAFLSDQPSSGADEPAIIKAKKFQLALIKAITTNNCDPNKFLAAAKALANYINGLDLDYIDSLNELEFEPSPPPSPRREDPPIIAPFVAPTTPAPTSPTSTEPSISAKHKDLIISPIPASPKVDRTKAPPSPAPTRKGDAEPVLAPVPQLAPISVEREIEVTPIPEPVPEPAPAPVEEKEGPAEKDAFQIPSAPPFEPQTFDQHIQAVANKIQQHIALIDLGEGDPVTVIVRAIASELTNIAESSRWGFKQEMVQAGRNSCDRVGDLCSLLSEYASRCRDPRIKDRLLLSIQAMKTYSIQLKILTAVKGSDSIESDADTEDQLIAVTKSLGNAINESVNCVKIMRGGRLLN